MAAKQSSFFRDSKTGERGVRTLEIADGGLLEYFQYWVSAEEADRLFHTLRAEVPWEQVILPMMGGTPEPRLSAWIGDPGCTYTYSGKKRTPQAWTPTLAWIRERVQKSAGHLFNGVLCNLYRGERDSIGPHSDDEPEFGQNPTVGSVSLGAVRRFFFKHKAGTSPRVDIDLAHGSLLVMRGTTQHFWKHGINKLDAPTGERINLTFRLLTR